MSETGKPRHIRDIAHIYLSRLQSSRSVAHDRLVVCGETRKTFPAFHTAALAASVALKGSAAPAPLDVTVFDVSGILPNVGYYFALPAQTYLARNHDRCAVRVTALMGVKLAYSWHRNDLRSTVASSPRFEIHHIPPYEDRKRFQHALTGIRRAPAGNTVFLFITQDGERLSDMREAVSSCMGETPVYTLGIGTGPPEFIANQVGTVTAWESSVADRIPTVCRDPLSTLARSYQSICEGLLYKIRENRREYGGSGIHRRSSRLNAVRSNNR